jgi:8-oxo-dGTP pyrophosphatase MutT (NUDIX family)
VIETCDSIQPAHPSATVVLLREGVSGPEVLLVQRNKALRHMGGMWVFPGGRIEAADYGSDCDPDQAALNAAVRETREETGVDLDPERLTWFAHWTTPEGARKRFATWFFLGLLTPGTEVVVDGGEIAAHRWVSPKQALGELADPDHPLRLMPPTYISLLQLDGFSSGEQAFAALMHQAPAYFVPRMVLVEDGVCFLYQDDCGYHREQLQLSGPRHRTYMINGQLNYVRDQG